MHGEQSLQSPQRLSLPERTKVKSFDDESDGEETATIAATTNQFPASDADVWRGNAQYFDAERVTPDETAVCQTSTSTNASKTRKGNRPGLRSRLAALSYLYEQIDAADSAAATGTLNCATGKQAANDKVTPELSAADDAVVCSAFQIVVPDGQGDLDNAIVDHSASDESGPKIVAMVQATDRQYRNEEFAADQAPSVTLTGVVDGGDSAAVADNACTGHSAFDCSAAAIGMSASDKTHRGRSNVSHALRCRLAIISSRYSL